MPMQIAQNPAATHALAVLLGGGACLGAFAFDPPTASQAATVAADSSYAAAVGAGALDPATAAAFGDAPESTPAVRAAIEQAGGETRNTVTRVTVPVDAATPALAGDGTRRDPRRPTGDEVLASGFAPAPDADVSMLDAPPVGTPSSDASTASDGFMADDPIGLVEMDDAEVDDEPLIIID